MNFPPAVPDGPFHNLRASKSIDRRFRTSTIINERIGRVILVKKLPMHFYKPQLHQLWSESRIGRINARLTTCLKSATTRILTLITFCNKYIMQRGLHSQRAVHAVHKCISLSITLIALSEIWFQQSFQIFRRCCYPTLIHSLKK